MPGSTSRSSVPCDPYLSSVTQHHEYYDNLKFTGRSRPSIPAGAVTEAILSQHYGLIPITFDPGGRLGPLASSFLWDRGRRPHFALPLRKDNRSTRGLSLSSAINAAHLALQLFLTALFALLILNGVTPIPMVGTPVITRLSLLLNGPFRS